MNTLFPTCFLLMCLVIVVRIGNNRTYESFETVQGNESPDITRYDVQNKLLEIVFVSFMDNIVSRGFYSADFFEDGINHFKVLSIRDEYDIPTKNEKGLYEILVELQSLYTHTKENTPLQTRCDLKEYAKCSKTRYEFYDGYRDCYFIENPITINELIDIRKMLFRFLFEDILYKYGVLTVDINSLVDTATINTNNKIVQNGKLVSDGELFDFSIFEKTHSEHNQFRSFLVEYILNVLQLKVKQYALKDVIVENDIIKKSSEHILKKRC